MMTIITVPKLRDWLLHRIDAEQAAALEERLFVESPLADDLAATRYDLFDDYVRRRLGFDDRSRFEKFQLTNPMALHRLRVAKALAKTARNRRTHHRSFALASAIAAGIVLAVAVFSPLLKQSTDVPMQIDMPSMPTIALRASAQRGAEATSIELPSNTGRIRLQAELDDSTSAVVGHYALRVFDGDSRLFETRSLRVRTLGAIRFIETALPASVLGPGHRRIELSSDEPTSAARPTIWDLETRTPISR